MKWSSVLSRASAPKQAVVRALDRIDIDLDGEAADVVVIFAYPSQVDQFPAVMKAVAERHPGAALVGCSGAGVVGGGREIEREPVLGLTAAVLPGVHAEAFHLLPSEMELLGEEPLLWRRRFDVDAGEEPLFLLFPDPLTCDTTVLLAALDDAFPGSPVVGGRAIGGAQGDNWLFAGEEVYAVGAVGLMLRGNLVMETIVAQGCRPIGDPLFVTWAAEGVLCRLDGQRATAVVADLYDSLSSDDRDRFRKSLHLGVVMQDGEPVYRHGDFLIRNVLGMDPASGVLAVDERLRNGQVVQFHVRDAQTSADDLATRLGGFRRGLDGAVPHAALLFSCHRRGEHFYGVAHHDSNMIAGSLGQMPIGGFFCGGEIGPVGGRNFLHGYTSSIALFRPR